MNVLGDYIFKIKRNRQVCASDDSRTAKENAYILLENYLKRCEDGEIAMCKYYKNGVDSSEGTESLLGLSDGTIIDSNLIRTIKDDLDNKQHRIPIVNISGGGSVEIECNTYYMFGEVTALDISLLPQSDTNYLSEYMFEFSCGGVSATLSLPTEVKWVENNPIVLMPNKRYQITIINNMAVWAAYNNI